MNMVRIEGVLVQYNTNRFIFHLGHNMTYEEIYKEYSGR